MSNMIYPELIKEWVDTSHALAIEKGWWKTDSSGKAEKKSRNLGELLTLAVSELSEAHELVRKPEFDATKIWFDDKKPEGFPIEMADFIIRICDNIGALGIHVNSTFSHAAPLYKERKSSNRKSANIGERLMIITCDLSAAYNSSVTVMFDTYLFLALFEAIDLAFEHGIDIKGAIKLKHEFNMTRPPRHGGLRA